MNDDDGLDCDKSKKSLLSIINKDGYIITNDSFIKIILILYRIAANIPVILMRETGCGKTDLIKKLNQLLTNVSSPDKLLILREFHSKDLYLLNWLIFP